MFFAFKNDMLKGEICKFYELSTSGEESAQMECVKNYDDNKDFYIEAAGTRYEAFLAGIFLPLVFATWEFFQNQLLMSWRHILYQYIFTAFYALITFTWQ